MRRFYTLNGKINIKSIAGKIKLLYNDSAAIESALVFSRSKGSRREDVNASEWIYALFARLIEKGAGTSGRIG